MTENDKRMMLFCLVTFFVSWAIWVPVAILRPQNMAIAVPIVILGAFAPTLVGVAMGGVFAPREARRNFWRRAGSFRLIPWPWLVLIVLLFPTIYVVAFVADRLAGGAAFVLDPETFGSFGAILGFLVFMLLGGPLAEELGWRGYLLPAMLRRWRALSASLILAVIWVVWHGPLFLIEGTSQHAQGILTFKGAQWMIEVVCLSIIVTWVFVHTNHSALGAVLLHFFANLTFTVFAGPDYELEVVFGLVVTLLHVVLGLALVLALDPGTFRSNRSSRTHSGSQHER